MVLARSLALGHLRHSFSLLSHSAAKATNLSHFTVQARLFASKMPNPRVFFDMTADDEPVGRIIMEVS